jgi:hypothetical protein
MHHPNDPIITESRQWLGGHMVPTNRNERTIDS